MTISSALIIGGDSTIGNALHTALCEQGIATTATTRRETIGYLPLNLAAQTQFWPELPDADVAFLCAAITKLDMCENHPDTTRIINVTHMQALTEKLQEQGTFIVFLSSNQVFDGASPFRKTTDTPIPATHYGKQKAEFESWLLARNHPAAVLRLSKVISGPLPVIESWRESLKKSEPVEAFTDLLFAPLPLDCVINAMQQIGEKKRAGIFHLSGTRDLSYYNIGLMLARKLGADPALIKPVSATSRDIPPNFLPKHGTLESSPFEGIIVPDPESFII